MDVSTKNKYSKNYWPSDKELTLIIDKVSGDYGYQIEGKRYIQSFSNESFIKDNQLSFIVYFENRPENCTIEVLNDERVTEEEFKS